MVSTVQKEVVSVRNSRCTFSDVLCRQVKVEPEEEGGRHAAQYTEVLSQVTSSHVPVPGVSFEGKLC